MMKFHYIDEQKIISCYIEEKTYIKILFIYMWKSQKAKFFFVFLKIQNGFSQSIQIRTDEKEVH